MSCVFAAVVSTALHHPALRHLGFAAHRRSTPSATLRSHAFKNENKPGAWLAHDVALLRRQGDS